MLEERAGARVAVVSAIAAMLRCVARKAAEVARRIATDSASGLTHVDVAGVCLLAGVFAQGCA